MKKPKNIQVFLDQSQYCEINDQLLSEEFKEGIYSVTTADSNGTHWLHRIPYARIHMVRIREEK